MKLLAAACLALFAVASPAHAAWLRATSRHFVVYSNTSDAALRRQATELEQLDAMIRRFHGNGSDVDAQFNRVTVFVVPGADAVARLLGSRNVAGFYVPRVTGSVAFTPLAGANGSGDLTPRIVLFHEYAHHFLFGNSTGAYPRWFSEGYAEFVSTMMERDGAYWLGAAANHRAYGLVGDGRLSIRQLLAPPETMTDRQVDSLYARGWLFTHYLMFDADRRRQLARYVTLFNDGRSSIDAGTEAFGDLKALDRALDSYLDRRTIPAIRIDATAFAAPAIDVRPLSAGESALIGYRIRSTRGVDRKTAGPLYAKAAVAAAPFGKDAVAQGWLAEMAFDAGRLDAAEAAADAAIAVDPVSSQALLYKARVHLARAVVARATDAAVWTEARSWIIRANRAQPNDAAALALFYQSFLAQKAPPTASAAAGLYRAVDLVPQDPSMRFLAARQLILDGQPARARTMLRALASDPHSKNTAAARLLALLDAGRSGQAAIDALDAAGDTDAKEATRDGAGKGAGEGDGAGGAATGG